MNILLTGCTTIHVNGKRKKDDYLSPFSILYGLLQDMGHTVDWRVAVSGEDLSMYDIGLIGLQPLYALNTVKHKFAALYAMDNMRHAIIIDDNQWRTIRNTFNSSDTFWKASHLGDGQLKFWDAGADHSESIERARRRLGRGYGAVLSTGFNWGDKSLFDAVHPTQHHHFWDPSPWVPHYAGKVDETLVLRQWACAALGNKDEWVEKQHCSQWPVIRQYKPSTKGMGQGRGEKVAWDRWSERRIVEKLYAYSAGIMAPVQALGLTWPGTGWWRVRFNYALEQVKRPMLCDPTEVSPLGKAFDPRASEMEIMSWGELSQLHMDQLGAFKEGASTVEQTISELEDFLESVSLRGTGL